MPEHLSESLNYREPSYWDGHGHEDDCSWTQDPRNIFLLDQKAGGYTRSILAKFFSQALRSPVRRFGKDQTFDTLEFEPGTVVRFSREFLSVHNPDLPGEIYTHWGVVSAHSQRKEEERGLVHVVHELLNKPQGPIRRVNPMLYYLLDSPIAIGEVQHEKIRLLNDAGEVWKQEFLSRITRLEIMEAANP